MLAGLIFYLNSAKTMKKKFQMICLLLWWPLMSTMHAQAPDYESLPLGWRVKIDRPVTVYGDYMGHPNPYDRFTMNARYFFQLIGTQVVGCDPLPNDPFTKILIPGTPADTTGKNIRVREMENPFRPKLNELVEQFTVNLDSTDKELVNAIEGFLRTLALELKEETDGTVSCPDYYISGSLQEKQLQDTEKGRTFWIKTSELVGDDLDPDQSNPIEEGDVDLDRFDQARLFSGTFVSILAVPFKYRFSYRKGGTTMLTGESSVGPCLGLRLHRSKFFDRNLWAMGSAGITFINPNLLLSDSTATRLKTEAGVTACVGIGGNVGTTQFGIVHGWDLTDRTWAFHGKPWVAFSVGVALVKRDAKSTKQ